MHGTRMVAVRAAIGWMESFRDLESQPLRMPNASNLRDCVSYPSPTAPAGRCTAGCACETRPAGGGRTRGEGRAARWMQMDGGRWRGHRLWGGWWVAGWVRGRFGRACGARAGGCVAQEECADPGLFLKRKGADECGVDRGPPA